jgi:hypothetical protein
MFFERNVFGPFWAPSENFETFSCCVCTFPENWEKVFSSWAASNFFGKRAFLVMHLPRKF